MAYMAEAAQSEVKKMLAMIEQEVKGTEEIISNLKKKLYYVSIPAPLVGVSGRAGKTSYVGFLEEKLTDLHFKISENKRVLGNIVELIDI